MQRTNVYKTFYFHTCMRHNIILYFILLLLDFSTKILLHEKNILLFPFFLLTFTRNTGTLFGLFPQSNRLFICISAALIGVLLYLYHTEKNYRLPFTLLLAGASGNLLDRILHGYVTDFLDFKIWPVFNIADIYIVIGILLCILTMYREKNSPL